MSSYDCRVSAARWRLCLTLLLLCTASGALADNATNTPAADTADTHAAGEFIFSTNGLSPENGLVLDGTNWVAGSGEAHTPMIIPVQRQAAAPLATLTPSRFQLATNYPLFSIVVIPDSQGIMFQLNSNLWKQTVEWMEMMKPLNIAAVLGVGDCVDSCENTNQWLTYAYGLQYFTNTPFVLAAGNHDVSFAPRNYTIFNYFVSSNFYASKPWWDSAGHGFLTNGRQQNMYITLTNGPLKLLFGTIEFGPTTNQALWFFNVCASHPDHLCFLTTHNYLNRDGSLNVNGRITNSTNVSYSPLAYSLPDSCDGQGLLALLKGVPNLGLIVCGHHICSPNEAFRTDLGDRGNFINGQFVNYQCDRYYSGLDAGKYVSRLKVITFTPGGSGWARTYDAGRLTWTNAMYDHAVTLTGSLQ